MSEITERILELIDIFDSHQVYGFPFSYRRGIKHFQIKNSFRNPSFPSGYTIFRVEIVSGNIYFPTGKKPFANILNIELSKLMFQNVEGYYHPISYYRYNNKFIS